MKTQNDLTNHCMIPSLYFLEGLHYSFLTTVSVVLYKMLHVSNTKITFYTSLFTIPFLLKPFISPLIENYNNKRIFILLLSMTISLLLILISLSLFLKDNFTLSIFIFFIFAMIAAMYDICVDGFYLTQLTTKMQAKLLGIRTLCYQLGKLFSQGIIIFIASLLFSYFGIQFGWQITLLLLSLFLLFVCCYHYFFITSNKQKKMRISHLHSYQQVYREFIHLPNLVFILFFIFIYHFGENQLIKILPLFLLDTTQHGGLEMSVASVSLLNGFIPIIGILTGIFLSSHLMARLSFRICFLPITFYASIINLAYVLLSMLLLKNILLVAIIIFLTQFGFGLSNGLYLFFLMQHFGKGNYPMSLYTIATALMGLSVTIAGAISGYLQFLLGYQIFFIWVSFISLMTLMFSFFLFKKELI